MFFRRNYMKKILFTLLILISGFLFIGCRKKTIINNLDEAIAYVIKNKGKDDNLKIENNAIVGLKNPDKVDGVLYLEKAETLKKDALKNNSKIRSLIIGEDVKKVESSAITGLDALENIYFLGDKKLEFNAVNLNSKLKKVYFNNTKLDATNNPFMQNENLEEFIIRDGKNIQYRNNQLLTLANNETNVLSLTNKFNGKFDQAATKVLQHAGGLNTYNFTEITFGSNSKMKTIESYIFSNLASLKKITFPKSIEKVNPDFAAIHSLSEIVIEDGSVDFKVVNNSLIKDDTLILGSKKTNLEDVSSVKKIGKAAFAGNISLELDDIKKAISNKIKEIMSQAFLGCISLKGTLDLSAKNFDKLGSQLFKGIPKSGEKAFTVSIPAVGSIAADWDQR